MVLSNIQRFVSRPGMAAPGKGLDVLRLADCSLRDYLTLIRLHRVLTSKRSGPESRIAEVLWLEQ